MSWCSDQRFLGHFIAPGKDLTKLTSPTHEPKSVQKDSRNKNSQKEVHSTENKRREYLALVLSAVYFFLTVLVPGVLLDRFRLMRGRSELCQILSGSNKVTQEALIRTPGHSDYHVN
ncbi:hypothetical protein DMENIID0001_144630 [Sergentomyia squamirostris]